MESSKKSVDSATMGPPSTTPDTVWERTHPFLMDVTVTAAHVDGYGHVSTANFVHWMIDCAFAHSAAVGLPESVCQAMSRGMAAIHFDVDLLGSAYATDSLQVATWIVDPDSKLRLGRQFQIVNTATRKTLARGRFNFVCTNLATGRPTRMPAIFAERYIVISEPVCLDKPTR